MECLQENVLQDFDWAMGLNRFGLQLMGAWPVAQDEKFKFFRTALRIPLMIIVMFCGLFLPQMYALTLVIEQLPLVIDNVMTSCTTLTTCIKLFFVWRSKRVLEPVLDSALQDYLRPKSRLEWLTMRREAYRGRFITIVDYTLMAISFMGFIIMPLLGFNIRTINNITDYGHQAFIVQSYFPYDYSKSPAFELSHVLQLAGCCFVAMGVAIPDDFFCSLVLHASAQFDILGLQIENLGKNGVEERFDEKLLKKFIQRHVHLNRIISAVEKSFGFVIAGQIFCMSTMVCCLGVQVLRMQSNTGEKPTPRQILTLSATILTLLVHTFVNCFVSENLASRSSEVFFKIYSSKWYMLPWKKMRCLVPMMLVAQTPQRIRAGKIMPMSLATYCSIIKSTVGYISMLIAVSGR